MVVNDTRSVARVPSIGRDSRFAGAQCATCKGERLAEKDVDPRFLAARAERAAAHQRYEVKRAALLTFIRERTPEGSVPDFKMIARESVARGFHSATTSWGDIERTYRRIWLKRGAIKATWTPPLNFEV